MWQTLNRNEVMKKLKSDPEIGISDKEAAYRQEKYGKNKLEEKSKESIFIKFLKQFNDFMIIILIIASIVSAVVSNMQGENDYIDSIIIIAIVIVNALGDIFDPFDGNKKIAGLLTNNRTEFADTCSALYNFIAPRDMFTGNTTIGAIITNADFNKGELNKIASMTRNAYARCINPVGTMADGDSIYAASTGNIKADINVIGTLSAEVMSAAIVNAIKESSIPDEEFLSNIK